MVRRGKPRRFSLSLGFGLVIVATFLLVFLHPGVRGESDAAYMGMIPWIAAGLIGGIIMMARYRGY